MLSSTPLRFFSQVAPDPVMLFCMLTMTISIKDMPVTKITGLNAVEMRLPTVNILPSAHHQSQSFLPKTWKRIRKGDPMMNTRSSQILMILAIRSNKSPIVKKKIRKNLSANARVRGAIALLPTPIYSWKLNTADPR